MAYTYSKIASVTVGSNSPKSMDFIAIPQNYTDLLIKISGRTTNSGTRDSLVMSFNSVDTTYTWRWFIGIDSASVNVNNGTGTFGGWFNGDTSTADIFGNTEIYIPNYSNNNFSKIISSDTVAENQSSTSSLLGFMTYAWSGTQPINSIRIAADAGSLKQYSTATLYGIKAEV